MRLREEIVSQHVFRRIAVVPFRKNTKTCFHISKHACYFFLKTVKKHTKLVFYVLVFQPHWGQDQFQLMTFSKHKTELITLVKQRKGGYGTYIAHVCAQPENKSSFTVKLVITVINVGYGRMEGGVVYCWWIADFGWSCSWNEEGKWHYILCPFCWDLYQNTTNNTLKQQKNHSISTAMS